MDSNKIDIIINQILPSEEGAITIDELISFINNYNDEVIKDSSIYKPDTTIIVAEKYADNEILVIFGDEQESNLYACVILFEENNYKIQEVTLFTSDFNSKDIPSIAAVADNEAIITYVNKNSKLMAVKHSSVLTNAERTVPTEDPEISETKLVTEVKSQIEIYNNAILELNSNRNSVIIKKVNDNQYIIIYNYDETDIYGIIVDAKMVSAGAPIKLGSTIQYDLCISATVLLSNKVFITYTDNNYLYAKLFDIEGNEFVLKSNMVLTENLVEHSKVLNVLLDSNSIFIIYNDRDNDKFLYGMICRIVDNGIEKGKNTMLHAIIYSDYLISALTLDSYNVKLIERIDDNYKIKLTIRKIVRTKHEMNVEQDSFDKYCDYGDIIAVAADNEYVSILHYNQKEIFI